jgi:hypothetical protein
MANIEKVIQSALIRWIHDTYPFLMVTTTGNEKFYKEIIACIGVTDLILFHRDGHVLFLELKKKSGKLLDSQKDFNAMFDTHFTAKNYSRDVAYGYSHAIDIIQKWLACFQQSDSAGI